MPSRPLAAGARRLRLNGKVRLKADATTTNGEVRLKPDAPYSVSLDLSQAATAPRAKGSIRIAGAAPGETLDAIEIGVLQTAKDWASVTAMVRDKSSGAAHAATIIVEHADPFVDGRPRTVTIAVEGRPRITGVLQ
jgi:hypothetical protein